ncbi:OmpA family protein [Aureibacter tunicatorum]|uniref:Outer membrane protein OmpA-like peptidoglycan-associated protein n=1 Tax=Aureibacter tunicatorum TaxID=866807 RepID=A0AAE3XKF9_9BACT|nr:OmpA family protein [Aureibacter tunicatorum]MDR6237638.1 outer membrane protein OmpA-like peptidoglycan-associated protein [Aureibacter tunicatorum]BDD02673.1 hypothetical protein AUTU_01560 [Aureibacter tunicatorum]
MNKVATVLVFLLMAFSARAQQVPYFYSVEKLPINSELPTFFPLYNDSMDVLYVVKANMLEDESGETSYESQDIFHYKFSDLKAGGVYDSLLNNKRNNAVVGISYSGDTLYLLGTYDKRAKKANGLSYTRLEENEWVKPEQMKVHGKNVIDSLYSFYVHPEGDLVILSKFPDKKSDNEDLYISMLGKNGKWSDPHRLPSNINSPYYEITPFMSDDKNTLYFSSNRPGGKGSADVYMSQRLGNDYSQWTDPVNMGKHVNTSAFDAYFSIYPNEEMAFVASTRERKKIEVFMLSSKKYEPEAIVEEVPAVLPKPKVAKAPIFMPILFDFDKTYIRAGYKMMLKQEVVPFLMDNPTYDVMVIGHTDHIGSETYNEDLSRRRALSIFNFLQQHDISPSRMKIVGKGFSDPAAPNTTKEGRQKNRRVILMLKDRN